MIETGGVLPTHEAGETLKAHPTMESIQLKLLAHDKLILLKPDVDVYESKPTDIVVTPEQASEIVENPSVPLKDLNTASRAESAEEWKKRGVDHNQAYLDWSANIGRNANAQGDRKAFLLKFLEKEVPAGSAQITQAEINQLYAQCVGDETQMDSFNKRILEMCSDGGQISNAKFLENREQIAWLARQLYGVKTMGIITTEGINGLIKAQDKNTKDQVKKDLQPNADGNPSKLNAPRAEDEVPVIDEFRRLLGLGRSIAAEATAKNVVDDSKGAGDGKVETQPKISKPKENVIITSAQQEEINALTAQRNKIKDAMRTFDKQKIRTSETDEGRKAQEARLKEIQKRLDELQPPATPPSAKPPTALSPGPRTFNRADLPSPKSLGLKTPSPIEAPIAPLSPEPPAKPPEPVREITKEQAITTIRSTIAEFDNVIAEHSEGNPSRTRMLFQMSKTLGAFKSSDEAVDAVTTQWNDSRGKIKLATDYVANLQLESRLRDMSNHIPILLRLLDGSEKEVTSREITPIGTYLYGQFETNISYITKITNPQNNEVIFDRAPYTKAATFLISQVTPEATTLPTPPFTEPPATPSPLNPKAPRTFNRAELNIPPTLRPFEQPLAEAVPAPTEAAASTKAPTVTPEGHGNSPSLVDRFRSILPKRKPAAKPTGEEPGKADASQTEQPNQDKIIRELYEIRVPLTPEKFLNKESYDTQATQVIYKSFTEALRVASFGSNPEVTAKQIADDLDSYVTDETAPIIGIIAPDVITHLLDLQNASSNETNLSTKIKNDILPAVKTAAENNSVSNLALIKTAQLLEMMGWQTIRNGSMTGKIQTALIIMNRLF